MKPTEGPLTCRSCGKTPQQCGDDVGPNAHAYTCARCLVGTPE